MMIDAATTTVATATTPVQTTKPVLAERFKTKPCRNYLQTGECPYQHRCMFSHGEHEVRTKEQNIRDGLTTEEAIKNFQRRGRPANNVAQVSPQAYRQPMMMPPHMQQQQPMHVAAPHHGAPAAFMHDPYATQDYYASYYAQHPAQQPAYHSGAQYPQYPEQYYAAPVCTCPHCHHEVAASPASTTVAHPMVAEAPAVEQPVSPVREAPAPVAPSPVKRAVKADPILAAFSTVPTTAVEAP